MVDVARTEVIASNLASVQSRINRACLSASRDPSSITLIGVTKTYPVSDIKILAGLGIKDFGENRDSEGREKASQVEGRWHFQGQIQSNKLASIASWADVVHSLDDMSHVPRLARAVGEGKKIGVFIQVSLDNSVGRGGLAPDSLAEMAQLILTFPALLLQGLMAVAPLGENPDAAFSRLAVIHSVFSQQFPFASALSAGMSQDFESAISHGATHVRIGSSILGSRSNPL